MRGSSGGAEARFEPPRTVDPADVALPEGFRIEVVATGLTFPTGIAFDNQGRAYVTESGYSYGEIFLTPRLLRLDAAGPVVVAEGETNGPWNGLDYADGRFYIAEGGQLDGGRILRLDEDGSNPTALVDSLPSLGDHHTNGPAAGPGGWIYFAQGTATNSAVVGLDNYDYGWLSRFPDFHDVPCRDVILAGRNYVTQNPFFNRRDEAAATGRDRAHPAVLGREVSTGAYVPFGTKTHRGEVIEGRVPCSGAIMRVPAGGGEVELVAWGLRNPYGLAFAPDGSLFATENGYDDRGSRPAWGTGDYLWKIEEGQWYGWPDFAGGVPLSVFDPPGKSDPMPVLAEHPASPPDPVALLAVHSSSNGLDFSRSGAFGYEGQAFIAQFGDMAPTAGKVLAPAGFAVVRVDVETGVVHGFAANKGKKRQPATREESNGMERPIAVRFNPEGTALYIVDFGVLTIDDGAIFPEPETGVVWRIVREDRP